MCRIHAGCVLLVVACCVVTQVIADEATTLFCLAAEQLPTCFNAQVTAMEGAEGDTAVVFNTEGARIGAQLQLEPGAYAVVVRAFAPSAGQDALYIEVAGRSTRRARACRSSSGFPARGCTCSGGCLRRGCAATVRPC